MLSSSGDRATTSAGDARCAMQRARGDGKSSEIRDLPEKIPATGTGSPGVATRAALRHAGCSAVQSPCSMSAIRVIKKYPNRRLYDTEISSAMPRPART
jgi:hypothetical protein